MATPQSSSELLIRAASFAPASFDTEARTVRAIWSTGAAVQRSDFEGPYDEVLSMDPNDVDLSELNGGPILNSHNRFDLNSILGVVEDPTITPDGRGVATLRFSDRPEIQGIVNDVRSGVINRISVGYSVSKWDTSRAADGKRTKTARSWRPAEISLVATGADRGARTRSSEEIMEQTLETQIRASGTLLGVDPYLPLE